MDKEQRAIEAKRLFPGGWPERLWFLWTTAILPTIAFALSMGQLHLVDWKDPALSTWPNLLIDRPGSLGFLPLASLVIITCLGIGIRPGQWVSSFPIRVVLGVGALLALQYAVLVMSALQLENKSHLGKAIVLVMSTVAAVGLASSGLGVIWRWIISRVGARRLYTNLGIFALVAWVPAAWWLKDVNSHLSFPRALLATPFVPLFAFQVISLMVGPVWSLQALARLQQHLGKASPQRPHHGVFAAVGLGGYLLSWRVALLEASRAYQKLPDQPPDCFVATAAAHGPTWLARGQAVHTTTGVSFRVTPQLQRLKLFELFLKVAAPAFHRSFRRIYNAVGPQLARKIKTPRRATFAWLLLKPAEWLAIGLVRGTVGKTVANSRPLLYGAKERSNGSL